MNSLFYSDIEEAELAPVKSLLREYSERFNTSIFMLKFPKSDLKEIETLYEGCFLLMCPQHKVVAINIDSNDAMLEDYYDEVVEKMSYLYSKYEYRNLLGRFSQWKGNILCEKLLPLSNIDSIRELLEECELTDPKDIKNAELLITLCTGSVNDIERVKADVPIRILDQVKQKIQAFDADQTRFIFQEEYQKKRVKIQGLSGTGKTELLLHKIKELYQNSDKSRIFVTCYNKILADYLRIRIPEFFDFMKVAKQIEWNKRLWCTYAWGRFHTADSGLYRFICDYYGIPYYSLREKSFESACKAAVADIKAKYPQGEIDYALDYIFVDECQDFPEAFFELCELVVATRLYMAGDIFQSIFEDKIERDYEADLFLTRCYRTDSRTLMFAHSLGLALFENPPLRWLSTKNWQACGYQCEEKKDTQEIVLQRQPVRRFVEIPADYPSVHIVDSAGHELAKTLCGVIHKIMDENPTLEVKDICIIMLDPDQSTYTLANLIEQEIYYEFHWEVNKAYESKKSNTPDKLIISNKNNVKGLEFPFVICVTKQLLRGAKYRNTLYTMLTRSFLQTYLVTYAPENNITDGIMSGYREIMNKYQMTIHVPSDDEIREIETRFNSEKNRKPMHEVLTELLSEMNLPREEYKKLYGMASIAASSWEGLSDDELRSNLERIKSML